MYKAARKKSVLDINVLEAGQMCKISLLTRAKLWWLDNWVTESQKWQVLGGVPSKQWLVPAQGRTLGDPATQSWVPKAQ